MAVIIHAEPKPNVYFGSPEGDSPVVDFSRVQSAVGGDVAIVNLAEGYLAVNEDGLRLGLPVNEAASLIAGQRIVGDAVLLGFTELD